MQCFEEVEEEDVRHAHHPRSLITKPEARALTVVSSCDISLVQETASSRRISTGDEGFDRVLGGGLMPNGVVAIDGPPGIGKTTLLMTAAGNITRRGGGVLMVTGEETVAQVTAAAKRLRCNPPGLRVFATQSLDEVFAEIRLLEEAGFPVHLLILDSVQAFRVARVSSPIGSQWMVGAVGEDLRQHAKDPKTPRSVIAVSQVTKDGAMAGPKALEHAVDTVLSFGRDGSDHRFLITKKNRFGPVGELAQYEMTGRGLRPLVDPNLMAWQDLAGDTGVAACICAHLAKPIVVTVEALVTPSEDASAGSRGVQVVGVSADRVRFVLDSLSRHSGVSFAKSAVRVHVPQVGGDDVEDSAMDLAIAAACWSSLTQKSLGGIVFWGSISLSGKMRSVVRNDGRLEYSEGIRARAALVGHPGKSLPPARVPVVSLSHLSGLVEAIEFLRGRYAREDEKPRAADEAAQSRRFTHDEGSAHRGHPHEASVGQDGEAFLREDDEGEGDEVAEIGGGEVSATSVRGYVPPWGE